MKLSRRQQIALKYLEQARWPVGWFHIQAALWMCGETGGQGNATADALVNRGLADVKHCLYTITDKGREVAKTINVTVQIEQVQT